MKQYIKNDTRQVLTLANEDNSITIIPINNNNKDYQLFLEEQTNGEAELLPYTPTVQVQTWEEIRAQRNALLQETDWVGLNDVGEVTNKRDWLEYRTALRNIPQSFSTPESVVWPQKPV